MINVPNTKLLGQLCLDNFIYDPIDDELEALANFFQTADLSVWLLKLKQWKAVALTYAHFEVDTMSSPLYDHKMMCNLVNAAWLLYQNPALPNQNRDSVLTALNCELKEDTKHLSLAECADPILGIVNFFEVFSLSEVHQLLYEWLSIGYSPNVKVADEDLSRSFYKCLRKLMECCWLLVKRKGKEDGKEKEAPPRANFSSLNERIPEAALNGFKQFLSVVPAHRLNRSLRKMLIDYLHYNLNGLPVDFEETLTDLYWLGELLDEIEGKEVAPQFL